jgi:hypothetical protein
MTALQTAPRGLSRLTCHSPPPETGASRLRSRHPGFRSCRIGGSLVAEFILSAAMDRPSG